MKAGETPPAKDEAVDHGGTPGSPHRDPTNAYGCNAARKCRYRECRMPAHEGTAHTPKKNARRVPTITRPTGLRIESNAGTTASNTPGEPQEAERTNERTLNEAPDHDEAREASADDISGRYKRPRRRLFRIRSVRNHAASCRPLLMVEGWVSDESPGSDR